MAKDVVGIIAVAEGWEQRKLIEEDLRGHHITETKAIPTCSVLHAKDSHPEKRTPQLSGRCQPRTQVLVT